MCFLSISLSQAVSEAFTFILFLSNLAWSSFPVPFYKNSLLSDFFLLMKIDVAFIYLIIGPLYQFYPVHSFPLHSCNQYMFTSGLNVAIKAYSGGPFDYPMSLACFFLQCLPRIMPDLTT